MDSAKNQIGNNKSFKPKNVLLGSKQFKNTQKPDLNFVVVSKFLFS